MSTLIKISVPRRAFVAPIATPHRRGKISSLAMTYKVTFIDKEGQEKVVDCRDDDYILDAADAGGVDLPASCRGEHCILVVAIQLGDLIVLINHYAAGLFIDAYVLQIHFLQEEFVEAVSPSLSLAT